MRKSLIFVCTSLVLACGCVSQVVPFSDYVDGWTGKKFEQFLERRNLPHKDRSKYKGKESLTTLDNGNLLYEFPYPLCPIFFEVNVSGTIVHITTDDGKKCF